MLLESTKLKLEVIAVLRELGTADADRRAPGGSQAEHRDMRAEQPESLDQHGRREVRHVEPDHDQAKTAGQALNQLERLSDGGRLDRLIPAPLQLPT